VIAIIVVQCDFDVGVKQQKALPEHFKSGNDTVLFSDQLGFAELLGIENGFAGQVSSLDVFQQCTGDDVAVFNGFHSLFVSQLLSEAGKMPVLMTGLTLSLTHL